MSKKLPENIGYQPPEAVLQSYLAVRAEPELQPYTVPEVDEELLAQIAENNKRIETNYPRSAKEQDHNRASLCF